jgi:predicted ATPase
MKRLTKMDLHGFKSIRRLADFPLGNLNVLIGANGAGKSNFIAFFQMLQRMMAPPRGLQFYVGKSGGANAILFDGAAVTPHMEAAVTFETDDGELEYRFRLSYAARDTLIFADERYRPSRPGSSETAWQVLGSGHAESALLPFLGRSGSPEQTIAELLTNCQSYQFHNTSETARIRQQWDRIAGNVLWRDGGNLAPFLLGLQLNHPNAYRRIVETLRQVMPFFGDFVFDVHEEPVQNTVLLGWRERNSDVVFSAHQASDGALRIMALTALLLQPAQLFPTVIILDEPELGLHPYAINVIAGLVKSASLRNQIILATQSTQLLDYFDPEDVIVVDRPDRESLFRRPNPEQLQEWLEEYSLSELWEKNVLGGRPGR